MDFAPPAMRSGVLGSRRRISSSLAAWRRVWPVVRADVVLLVACSLAVAFGILLRTGGFHADHFSFDEGHFVPNARNYIAGVADTNDHPPLGKLFIAAAIVLFGDKPDVWRLPSLIAGILSILLVHRLAAHLFEDERAGWFAASFLALDGFFISHARIAHLDGVLAMLILASALFVVKAERVWHVVAACVFIGLAASIKFSGIVMVPALLAALVLRFRTLRWALPALILIPGIYTAQYALGLHLAGQPAGLSEVVQATHRLVAHHASLTSMTNPATSAWFEWFLPTRPLTLFSDPTHDGQRMLTTLGHPLLWWSVNLTLVMMLVRLPQRAVAALAARYSRAGPASPGRLIGPTRPWAWALLLWVSPVLPWILSDRDSYIYHYLPAYGFGLAALGGAALACYRRAPVLTMIAFCVVAVTATFYAPVWAQLSLSQEAYELRLPFETWR